MSYLPSRATIWRFGWALVAMVMTGVGGVDLAAGDLPAPPSSPLSGLVRQLAEKNAAKQAAALPADKVAALKATFRFKPAGRWLVLPEMAKGLASNDAERAVVLEVLEKGAIEMNRVLAAEKHDNDVAAAVTVFLTQLWGYVRQEEVSGTALEAVYAQVASVMGGPEMGKAGDAEKQQLWEFCMGFPAFILAINEVATEPSAKADLRKLAAAGFASLFGASPELIDIGPNGLTVSKTAEAALAKQAEGAARVMPAQKSTGTVADAKRREGPGVSEITYIPPSGWTRETADWGTGFRATLHEMRNDGQPDPNSRARYVSYIGVLPVQEMEGGAQAMFNAMWTAQFSAYELGDTIAHYRSRLKSGLVVDYMGRFFRRKDAAEGDLQHYAVLYLIELGENRVRPIIALVVPNDPGLGMNVFKEGSAMRALAVPLAAMLDSIKPAKGSAPYPAGGYFSPAEIQGHWGTSSSSYGGMYVNSTTGLGAGAAVTSAGGSFRMGADGTYDYDFAYYSANPQFGNMKGSTRHSGRYQLDGDLIRVQPSKPISYQFGECVVGIGVQQTANGLKRVLITVGADGSGVFRSPPIIPNWATYEGTLTWYVEK